MSIIKELENTVLALRNEVKKLQTKIEIQEKFNLNCQSEINFLRSNIKKKDESNQVKSVII